ncbi:hypothetical protein F5B20DRAFT_565665 [Whalleya microplaca]|nr:hypothetical protein F5B20DRAFT_565665 [Whalleya microplaca]
MGSREMDRHDQESSTHLLDDEKLAHEMGDGEMASPDSYQSSWSNQSSYFSSFGRRLTRKHYFLALALLLVITLFLANPYHPIVDVRRLQSTEEGSDSHQHVISISLAPSASTKIQTITSITEATKTVEREVQVTEKHTTTQTEKAKAKPTSDPEDADAEKSTDKSTQKSSEKTSHKASSEDSEGEDKHVQKGKPHDKDKSGKSSEASKDESSEKSEEKAEDEEDESVEEEKDEKDKDDKDEPDGGKSGIVDYCTTWPLNSKGQLKQTQKPVSSMKLKSYAPEGGWKKPEGLKVVAMVFYGRKRNVDILDCYLRQNLASYGGYLDEVWFMVHTTIKDDVEWLRDFVEAEQEYKFMDLGRCTTDDYGCIWEYPNEDDTMYLKIDDDILYIHHDAIPQLIHTRLAQPHPFAVSAQLVNSPVTAIQQYHYGAIHPFLPDPKTRNYREPSVTWKPSEMGLYPPATRPIEGSPLDVESPYRGHHWLLLSNSSKNTEGLTRTPMGAYNKNPGGDDIAFGPTWKSWGAAAQQLYSLLYNLELNQMDRYFFGRPIDYRDPGDPPNTYSGPGGEQLFDMQYIRYNLNFLAMWGRDIKAGLPIHDDELEFTAEIPARLKRPFVIDTRSVVAHQSFFTQSKGIGSTDLMDRWRAFANENVCAADNQKTPFDYPCDDF